MAEAQKTIIWFGRGNVNYSRNVVVRQALARLGWRCADFKPCFSWSAGVEALFRRLPRAAAVWVPCFRQRDVKAAARFARRRKIPLIFDPLISSYDKQVFEHKKAPPRSPRAEALRAREAALFALADEVVADTACHKAFFHEALCVPEARVSVVYVGADASFAPPAAPPENAAPEVLFYGSFLGLQGAGTIVEAALRYAGPPVRWTLLGAGPERAACEEKAKGCEAIVFEPPVAYADLPGRIGRADILLGVFGQSPKASRVIPNKVFQALACGRPVITNESEAYPLGADERCGLYFVRPGDAAALAAAVEALARLSPEARAAQRRAARACFERHFGAEVVAGQIAGVLSKAGVL